MAQTRSRSTSSGDNVRDVRDSVMSEFDRDRQHELRMAQVNADAAKHSAVQSRITAESRHGLIAGILVGVAVLLVLTGIIGAIVWNVSDDRARDADRDRLNAEVARDCIEAGNIWVNNDCLIAQRDTP